MFLWYGGNHFMTYMASHTKSTGLKFTVTLSLRTSQVAGLLPKNEFGNTPKLYQGV